MELAPLKKAICYIVEKVYTYISLLVVLEHKNKIKTRAFDIVPIFLQQAEVALQTTNGIQEDAIEHQLIRMK